MHLWKQETTSESPSDRAEKWVTTFPKQLSACSCCLQVSRFIDKLLSSTIIGYPIRSPTVLYAQPSVRSISITTTSPSDGCTPPEPGGYTLTLQPGATCTLKCSVTVENYNNELHSILIDFKSGRYFNESMIGRSPVEESLGASVVRHSKDIDITEELPHIHCRFLVHDMLFYSQLLPITVNHGTVLLLHTLTTTLCFLRTVATEPPYSSPSSSILPTPSSSTFTMGPVSSTPNTQQGMG